LRQENRSRCLRLPCTVLIAPLITIFLLKESTANALLGGLHSGIVLLSQVDSLLNLQSHFAIIGYGIKVRSLDIVYHLHLVFLGSCGQL
jgi:hypothetical protein